MTTEYPLRRSRLDSMSRFISLSSTSKSLGMINVSGGTPALTSSLCFWWCERETGVVMVSVVIDERAIRCFSIRTCKTVAVNRLDEIVRSSQVQAHGLVVHDRNHNHRDLGQFRVCLQPAEHRPAIAVGHDDVQDRKSTRLNSSHVENSYAVFCLKKKKNFRKRSTTPYQVLGRCPSDRARRQDQSPTGWCSDSRAGLTRATDSCREAFFFFRDPATTEIYTLSLHDALPI